MINNKERADPRYMGRLDTVERLWRFYAMNLLAR